MDNDASWCPVCDKHIQPKRYQVPVIPPTTPTPTPPAPPPSSPVRRTKTARQRGGGLVQGTGCVKPNGALKRTDSKYKTQPQPQVKLRTVIDQGPTPLYCSDECQMVDLNRGLSHNCNPDRLRSNSSPVAFSPRTADSDSTTSSSPESQSSVESATSLSTYNSPSLATLAATYNFPPPPPPAPVHENETPLPSPTPNDYSSGVMMAARRITTELCSKPQERNAYGHIISSTEPRKPIPGWTDGSNAWRSSIYSFTATNSSTPVPHKSFVTRPSRGVQSYPRTTSASLPTYPASETDVELLTWFSQSFRRTSRPSTSQSASPAPLSSSSSFPASFPPTPLQKRERSLLQRGAEGKLLVPPVMMRVNSSALSMSLSSEWSAPSSRRSARSPLSQASSAGLEDDRTQRCDSATSLFQKSKRPTVETRSWSYDNIKTYPVMRLPPKTRIEKRTEKRLVDGEEVEVEVEVEVEIEEKLKRLFHFQAPNATHHTHLPNDSHDFALLSAAAYPYHRRLRTPKPPPASAPSPTTCTITNTTFVSGLHYLSLALGSSLRGERSPLVL
ncbi:hypothetical protein D9615_010199 [Tricholomella constricta]|uniref:Uncharacterized protein n=1 Tax=Tricholomella constricta TaxID=117010 RepID=A0A8H5GNG6_9AGAR|nr:hypothetical protein D9615_010199 [Tricholomella constricta]